MTEAIPAIMPKDFSDLREKVSLVSPYISSVQIDLMDGKLVKEKTWPYFSYKDEAFAELLAEKNGLPEWDDIDYEVDLMSLTPESDAFDWIQIGARRVILHVESTDELSKIIEGIRAQYGYPKESLVAPEIGIAANNDTPLSEWMEVIPKVDFVQCMGIAQIGYQGQPFDERVIERITTLREKFPELIISVDGGVSDITASKLVKAGANRLVSGSFIFDNQNPKQAIELLQNL